MTNGEDFLKSKKIHPSIPRLPKRVIWLPMLVLVWNQLTYQGAFLLAAGRDHHSLALALDRAIPLVPWTISIYFGCFAFWAVHYIWIAWDGGSLARRFFGADILTKGISFVIFLVFPTVMARPEITGSGFWNDAMRFLYWLDQPYNLFPSIHCAISWLCWDSVRGNERFPRWYRVLTFVCGVAVCISTLTTRQHVLADILGGIALAEICWCLTPRLFAKTDK